MTDGLTGDTNYKTGRWLGFQEKDLDAAIDLKQPVEISKVAFNTNVVKGDWIMGAAGVTVKVSEDGKNFREVVSKTIPSLKQTDKDGIYPQEITFDPVKARYVEVIIKVTNCRHGMAAQVIRPICSLTKLLFNRVKHQHKSRLKDLPLSDSKSSDGFLHQIIQALCEKQSSC